jgi:hypothetical protein
VCQKNASALSLNKAARFGSRPPLAKLPELLRKPKLCA